MTHDIRVQIVGGGYAGVMAANRLRRRPDIDISLLNPRPRFVERIRLHQLITGSDDARVDYADILAPGVQPMVGEATNIDTAARRVNLTDGTTLPYDYLVYAVGSGPAVPAVPGAQFAYPLSDLEAAERLRTALGRLPADAPVCVVGGGTTGVEMAAELAELGRPVTLACRVLAESLAAPGRRAVARRLRRLGVEVVDGSAVVEVRADAVVLDDGRRLDSAVTVWAGGFSVPGLAAASGLHTDTAGRLLTDETLTSLDDDRIVAAGDAAAPSGVPLRMSCQAALPLGAQAAETVLARLDGRAPAAVNQAFTGVSMSLGRRGGLIQPAHFDDRPLPIYIGGRGAAAVKELVCRSTLGFLRREARKPGSYRWPKGGRRPAPDPAVTP